MPNQTDSNSERSQVKEEVAAYFQEFGSRGVELFLAGIPIEKARAESEKCRAEVRAFLDWFGTDGVYKFLAGECLNDAICVHSRGLVEVARVEIKSHQDAIACLQSGIDQLDATIRDHTTKTEPSHV